MIVPLRWFDPATQVLQASTLLAELNPAHRRKGRETLQGREGRKTESRGKRLEVREKMTRIEETRGSEREEKLSERRKH